MFESILERLFNVYIQNLVDYLRVSSIIYFNSLHKFHSKTQSFYFSTVLVSVLALIPNDKVPRFRL